MTAGAHYRISKAKIDKEQSKELDRQRVVDEKHDFQVAMLAIVNLLFLIWLAILTAIITK